MRHLNEGCPEIETAKQDAGRIVSLLVAIACMAVAYFFGTRGTFHLTITILVLPLGCIWYGSEIGSFVGAPVTDEDRPGNVVGTLITLAGWIILLAILAIIVFSAFWGPQ